MNVLFVCTGNTCRSPMAEVLCREAARELGRSDVKVFSAGISAQVGAPASEQAQLVMKEYGLSLEKHAAHQLSETFAADADRIYTMTAAQKNLIQRLLPNHRSKIETLLEDGDVQDPFGRDADAYRLCAEQIAGGLKRIFEA